MPFEFVHKPLGWAMKIGFNGIYPGDMYIMEVNGVKYEDMPEAPPRKRADLARSAIKMQMDGPKKLSPYLSILSLLIKIILTVF